MTQVVGSSKSLHQLWWWLVASNNLHAFYPLLVRWGEAPPVWLECKMHTDCWIQQVTTRVGAVTCWIQQSVSPKQVVGFTCVFNSEIDQLIRKSSVPSSNEAPILTTFWPFEDIARFLYKLVNFRIKYTGESNNLLGWHRLLDPTSHCTNSGSDLLDQTSHYHFTFYPLLEKCGGQCKQCFGPLCKLLAHSC